MMKILDWVSILQLRKVKMNLEEWTDKGLIDKAKGLYWSINVLEVYNTQDMMILDSITDILEDRGYTTIWSIDFVKCSDSSEPIPGDSDYIGEEDENIY